MTDAADERRPSETTWDGYPPPPLPRPSLPARIAGGVRLGGALAATVSLLGVYMTFKAVERFAPGFRGRVFVQRHMWARFAAAMCGLRVRRIGAPMTQGGAFVSNHVSWSDIFILLIGARVTFVAKAEVRLWPGIGTIAALADTLFIERRRTASKHQEAELSSRIAGGEHLVFFPEATSTDGRRVVPFKSTLFSMFFSGALEDRDWVQPVSLVYRPNPRSGLPRSFYGWWGSMPFGGHIWQVLTLSYGGDAEVVFHEPVRARDFQDRKALAAYCHARVEEGLLARLDDVARGDGAAQGDAAGQGAAGQA